VLYRRRKEDRKQIPETAETGKCMAIPRTRNNTRRKYDTVEIDVGKDAVTPRICSLYKKYTKDEKGNAECTEHMGNFLRGAEPKEIDKKARGIICW
jgi:hypothetical protein